MDKGSAHDLKIKTRHVICQVRQKKSFIDEDFVLTPVLGETGFTGHPS